MSHLPARYISDAVAADLVRRRFSVNQDIALAIAMAESGLNVNAHNDRGEDSRGIFQVNVEPGANPQYASWDLYNPEVCIQAAWEISSGGTYFCPWSVFEESCSRWHTGSYRLYLDRARSALAGLPPPHTHVAASNLDIDLVSISPVISVRFHWTIGGPDLSGQRLDLAVYPFSFEQGLSFDLSASRSSMSFSGFVPEAGYYWRIVSFFPDEPSMLLSDQHAFITPSVPVPGPPPWPPPWPEPIPEPEVPVTLAMLLGAGLVATSLALALTPRKKKIKIIKS